MRSGDKHKTNRMFRRRIYAQGFTILAMLAGSIYWSGDRSKRGQYDTLVREKEQKEKHEAWLRELEVRAGEEDELRRLRKKIIDGQAAERKRLTEGEKRDAETRINQTKGDFGNVRCVTEASEECEGPIVAELRKLWNRRR